jgi:hypothetical protein
MSNNFISDNAARQISQMRRDVALLQQKINRLGVSGPRIGNRVFARLGAYNHTAKGYPGTQVRYIGNGWEDTTSGLSWPLNSKYLISVDSDSTALEGKVYPLDSFSDGTNNYWGFTSGQDTNISFRHYFDSTTGNLRFNDGNVFYGENTDPEKVTDNGTGWDLNDETNKSNTWWVETVTPYGENTTVLPVIQGNKEEDWGDGYWFNSTDLDSTTEGLITRTQLLTTNEDGRIEDVLFEGDIYFQSLYTPLFPENMTGSDKNEGKFLGAAEVIDSEDSTDFEYFYEGGIIRKRYLGGELMETIFDGTTRWGGITDPNLDHDFFADFTVEGSSIILSRDNYNAAFKAGLATEADITLNDSTKQIGALKWLGVESAESGAYFIHKNSPVDGESDENHWVKFAWDSSTISVNDSTVESLELLFDTPGHLYGYAIDGGEVIGQDPIVGGGIRYSPCPGEPTLANDIVFATDQGAVVSINAVCYEKQKSTQADPTAPVPTIDSTYADCTSCLSANENEQWKYCDNDSVAAIFGIMEAPEQEFAWLCRDSTWTRSYFDTQTEDAKTAPTPTFVEADSTVVSCLGDWGRADIPASDNFNGVPPNSGSLTDSYWTTRWRQVTTDGSTTHTGSAVTLTSPASATQKITDLYCNIPETSGEFIVKVDYNTTISAAGTNGVTLHVKIGGGGTIYFIQRVYSGGQHRIAWGTGGAGSSVIAAGDLLNSTMELSLIGTTLSAKVGGTTYKTWTIAGNLFDAWFNISTNAGAGAISCTYDNFIATAGGSDILIAGGGDITGDACP